MSVIGGKFALLLICGPWTGEVPDGSWTVLASEPDTASPDAEFVQLFAPGEDVQLLSFTGPLGAFHFSDAEAAWSARTALLAAPEEGARCIVVPPLTAHPAKAIQRRAAFAPGPDAPREAQHFGERADRIVIETHRAQERAMFVEGIDLADDIVGIDQWQRLFDETKRRIGVHQ